MKKNTTFEQAMARLDEIVAALDSGDVSLEQSLKLFGEGAELIGLCSDKLNNAKLTIEKLFPAEESQEVRSERL